jgi:hypothetical protein
MTTVFNEGRHAAEFILSEAEGTRSRDNVTLYGGFTGADKLKPGTVLGKLTSGGKYVASPASGADGSQTGVAVLIGWADISDGDVQAAVISRDAEVNGDCLEYEATVDQDSEKTAKATQLAAVGIIVR